MPKGWVWCRLGEIVQVVSGVSYKKNDIVSQGIRILRGGNIQNNKILLFDDDVFISDSYYDETNEVKQGDVIIVASTGSSILIGKSGFAEYDMKGSQIGAFLRIIRPQINSISQYLKYIFESDFYKDYIRDIAKGTNINNIKNEYVTNFEIPYPPLAEQHRIVTKIEQTFAQLDELEKAIKV